MVVSARYALRTASLTLACLALSVSLAAAPAQANPDRPRAQGADANSPERVAQALPWRTDARSQTDVSKARARLNASQRALAQLRADKAKLEASYQKQLAEIDRLKQQRASWRRDRAIRTSMGESHGTASQLSSLAKRIRKLESAIRTQKKAMVAAIDRELAASPSASRRVQLVTWRRQAQKGLRRNARKIVLPVDTIDPLADPEELEYQASLLRESEAELARELSRLEEQAKHYRHMATLRQKYQRADEFGRFDDDRPRRTSGSSTLRTQGANDVLEDGASPTAPPPPSPSDPESQVPGSDDLGGSLESDPMFDVVLADVVDSTTIRALRAAEVSSDPAVKAKAAERARKQVQERMERLRRQRQEMQKRAKSLQHAP